MSILLKGHFLSVLHQGNRANHQNSSGENGLEQGRALQKTTITMSWTSVWVTRWWQIDFHCLLRDLTNKACLWASVSCLNHRLGPFIDSGTPIKMKRGNYYQSGKMTTYTRRHYFARSWNSVCRSQKCKWTAIWTWMIEWNEECPESASETTRLD